MHVILMEVLCLQKLRQQRREKRVADLIHQDDEVTMNIENAVITRSKAADSAYLGKYSIWRRDYENDNADSTVKLIRDQIIMARVYASIARSRNSHDIYDELMKRSKESQRVLGEVNLDSELPHR